MIVHLLLYWMEMKVVELLVMKNDVWKKEMMIWMDLTYLGFLMMVTLMIFVVETTLF